MTPDLLEQKNYQEELKPFLVRRISSLIPNLTEVEVLRRQVMLDIQTLVEADESYRKPLIVEFSSLDRSWSLINNKQGGNTDQKQIRVDGSYGAGDLLQFAFANERGRIRAVAVLHKFARDLRSRRCHQFAKFGKRLFKPHAREAAGFGGFGSSLARQYSAGRHFQVAVTARAMAKLQGDQKGPLRAVTTSLDPVRGWETAGMLPRNRLALRLDRTAFAFRLSVLAGITVMHAAFGHDDGGDGVFKDELFLIVGFKDH